MRPSFLETFRALSSFQAEPQNLKDAPWEAYVDWAISQGLAPLAAYNLEYRLAGAEAPEWARDRLLSVYQGSVNDNVMKLVNFKRAVEGLQGRRVVLLGGASFAEALYPHVAFRPVLEIQLLLHPGDRDALLAQLAESHFKSTGSVDGPQTVLSDGRTELILSTHLLGPSRMPQQEAMFNRLLPMRVYGPSVFRLDLEDAILALCLEQARAGYRMPLLTFVDLRELLTGATSTGGAYSRPCNFALLKQRAADWRLERALFASASIVERLFPEAAGDAAQAKPALRRATRRLLERWVVDPLGELGKTREWRGADRFRRLLSGGLIFGP